MSSQIFVATPERTDILRFSETVRIGRAETNGVVISNDLLSGEHLELRKTGEIWQIVDLDSTNGTFIDGERVTCAPLGAETVARLGPAVPSCA